VHTYYFKVTSQIAYDLRLISNLQYGLNERTNVPSYGEDDLAFLFPDYRAAQITIRKCKHFYGWIFEINQRFSLSGWMQ